MARTWACFGVNRLHQSPQAVLQAIPVEVINSVVAIVATENVDAVSIDDSRVSVTWGRRLRVCDGQDFCPKTVIEVELEKVVSAVRSVVSTKDVEIIFYADGGMQRARTGRMSFIHLKAFNYMPSSRLFNPVLGYVVFAAVGREDVLVLANPHHSTV